MIDYIPYPEQIYLEIYHLLDPGETGEDADAGEDAGPGGDDDPDFDDL